MATERTQLVGTTTAPTVDLVTEECPWCGTEISRTRFLEIEGRIRVQEQKRLEEERKKFQELMRMQLQTETAKIKAEGEKQLKAILQAKEKAVRERDQAVQQSKEKEAAIKRQAQAQADQRLKGELAKTRAAIEKDRDDALIKAESKFAREREALSTKMKQLQAKLEQQRAHEIGDGAEVDVYNMLREVFPTDKITRIKKGEPGADIRHEILHKGDLCGTILYDSKKRQLWQNTFAHKLHADQVAAKAQHAILTTTAFPSGKKELCVVANVIAVNPARVAPLVELLRTSMIRMHVLGLSTQQRNSKTAKLYEFVTSEAFAQQSQEIGHIAEQLLGVDVDEKKLHDKTWSRRGALLMRLQRAHNDMGTHIGAILEGIDG